MHNLLLAPLIRVRRVSQPGVEHYSLPEIITLLCDGAIDSFPALRPHQRFAWHAFLVQLGALALHQARRSKVPDCAKDWAELLRGLTPAWPDDEPWCLVAPPDKPALLQAPVPSGTIADWSTVPTPDALDMLMTSRNHDLKRAQMVDAAPDDWLFALVTVQTMDGGLSGSYRGISRMNSDSGSRPCVTIRPGDRPGAWFARDVKILLRERPQIANRWGYRERGAALLWLKCWDGRGPIYSPADLDPLFIEICRRVRFESRDNRLVILKNTNKSLIGPGFHNGMTGDPWAPINVKEEKLFTIDGKKRFRYHRMIEFLEGRLFQPALLQNVDEGDASEGLSLFACAIVRGVGKTEGYHERRIPIAKKVVGLLKRGRTDEVAKAAHRRAELIGQIENALLRRALRHLFVERVGSSGQTGQRKLTPQQQTTLDRWIDRLDREADAEFFERLWEEFEPDDEQRRGAIRDAWLAAMIGRARDLLGRAADDLPQPRIHRYRARVRAEGVFMYAVRQHPSFRHLQWNTADD